MADTKVVQPVALSPLDDGSQSLWPRLLRACLVALLVALVVAIVAVVVLNVVGSNARKRVASQLAARSIPTTFDGQRAQVPAHHGRENGARHFEAAFLLIRAVDTAASGLPFLSENGPTPGPADTLSVDTLARVDAFVAENQAFFELIDLGRRHETFEYAFDPNDTLRMFNMLKGARRTVWWLTVKALAAQGRGDADAAVAACLAVADLNSSLDGCDDMFVDLFARHDLDERLASVVEHTLGRTDPQPPDLQALRQRLLARSALRAMWRAVASDITQSSEALQDVYHHFHTSHVRATSMNQLVASELGGPAASPPRTSSWQRFTDACVGLMVAICPGYAERKLAHDVEQLISIYDRLKPNPDQVETVLTVGRQLAAQKSDTAEIVLQALDWELRRKTSVDLAAVGVAIELHRLAHRAWPQSLAELDVPATDVYSGKALKYARNDTGVVLYSVGPDLADNGGGAAGDGADLVFRLYDPERRNGGGPAGDASGAGR